MNENARDRNIRPRLPAARRRQLTEDFAQRRESAADFARRHGVAVSTLHRWARAGMRTHAVRTGPPEFQEVRLATSPVAAWSGEVCLPDGTVLRWNGATGLAGTERLVNSLRRPC